MPIAGNNSTYALVIVSLGILGIIVSFLITEKKKYIAALVMSLFVVVMGLFQFATASFSQWQTHRRISKLQESQRLNLEALQSRLREASEKARAGGAVAPSPAGVPAAAPGFPPPGTPRKKKK